MQVTQLLDLIGKWMVVGVMLVLLVQLVRLALGHDVSPVPPGIESWTKWVGAMVAVGVAIRGLAKGFRSLL